MWRILKVSEKYDEKSNKSEILLYIFIYANLFFITLKIPYVYFLSIYACVIHVMP